MYEFTTPYNCCWKLPKDWKPCSCNFQAFDVIFNHGSSKLVFCRLEFENFSCGHSQVSVLNVRARKTRLMHSHQSFIQDSLRYTAQHCATKLQHSLPHCSFLMLLLNKTLFCKRSEVARWLLRWQRTVHHSVFPLSLWAADIKKILTFLERISSLKPWAIHLRARVFSFTKFKAFHGQFFSPKNCCFQ